MKIDSEVLLKQAFAELKKYCLDNSLVIGGVELFCKGLYIGYVDRGLGLPKRSFHIRLENWENESWAYVEIYKAYDEWSGNALNRVGDKDEWNTQVLKCIVVNLEACNKWRKAFNLPELK